MESLSEVVAASRVAFRRSDGAVALEKLGFWDLLPELDDPQCMLAAMGTFQAHGAELADSAALSGLMAQPYRELIGGTATAAVWMPRAHPRGTLRHLLVGPVRSGSVFVDMPGQGAFVLDSTVLQLRPLKLPGRMTLHEVETIGTATGDHLEEAVVAPARARAVRLARKAIAFEILGAAQAVFDLAVEHTRVREQFGRPIASFQAVQHLLAWAATDCAALEALITNGALFADEAIPDLDVVVKALAGRNGLLACERALQAFGAVAFTSEHEHHHFHSRVLLLDAVLGSRAQLTRTLGESWRTNPTDRRVSDAFLRAEHATA